MKQNLFLNFLVFCCQEYSQLFWNTTKMFKVSFNSKKDAIKELERVYNPKGLFMMKDNEVYKDRLWHYKCHEMNSDGRLEPSCCDFLATITCMQSTVGGRRVRKYHIALSCGEHEDCDKMSHMQRTQPRKKLCCENHPAKSQKLDWSKVENQEKMTGAAEEVKSGKLTQKAAAEKYSVPLSTLNKTLTGKRDVATKKGRPSAFPVHVEQTIELYALQMSDAATGLTFSNLRTIALQVMSTMDPENTEFKASDKWVHSFVLRHPRISRRRAQALEKNRARGLNEEITRDYFEVLETAIAYCKANSPSLDLPPDFIANLDESAAILQAEGKTVVGRKGSSSIHTVTEGGRSVSARISQVALVGGGTVRFHPSYLIEGIDLPLDQLLPWNYELVHLPAGHAYCMVPKGSLTDESWAKVVVPDIIKQYNALRAEKGMPDQWALIVLDGFTSHSYCVEALQMLLEAKIMVVRMPSHSSHALQPLDVAIFHSLKVLLRELIDCAAKESIIPLTKWDLLRLFHKSWEEVMLKINDFIYYIILKI
jgi:hypothetical protein